VHKKALEAVKNFGKVNIVGDSTASGDESVDVGASGKLVCTLRTRR